VSFGGGGGGTNALWGPGGGGASSSSVVVAAASSSPSVVVGAGLAHYQQHPGAAGNFYPGAMGPNNSEELSSKPGMLEVVAGLSRDCFIIPLACVDRFLPAGLTVSSLKIEKSYLQDCKKSALI
jgi:hypothetical protein